MYEEELRTLRSILSNLVRLFGEIRGEHDPPVPRPGSKADREVAQQREFVAAEGVTPVEECYEIAHLRLVVGRDYLESLERLMQEPPNVHGVAALVRVLLESSARAWWLLDPSIGVRGRVVRGLMERAISDIEASRLPSADLRSRAEAGVLRTLDEAVSLGFEVRRNRRGHLLSIDGTEVPRYTQLLDEQLGEIGVFGYRLLSATVHGSLYGLFSRSAVTKDSWGRYDSTVFNAHIESLIPSTGVAALGFIKAVERQLDLFGWDKIGWTALGTEAMRANMRLLDEGLGRWPSGFGDQSPSPGGEEVDG